MNYPQIVSRIFNTPLLIHPQKLDAIIAGLGPRLLGTENIHLPQTSAELPAEMFTTRRGQMREGREGARYRVVDNLAIVPVIGALSHRGRVDASSSYIQGYQDIARDLNAAAEDDQVEQILMVFDSPGGEATGAFEMPELIREIGSRKPITAAVDGMAASAGYLLASAANQIAIIPSGYAGSIGVVTRHVDFSRALANDGITVTHIYAGDHKVDGNPYEPLPADVRAQFQTEIDHLYQKFVSAVATARNLSEEHVRGTQARIYHAEDAIKTGLADRIATPDQLITELTGKRSKIFTTGQPAHSLSTGAQAMSEQQEAGVQKPATAAAPQAGTSFTQADLDKARAEGQAAGKQAEAERVSGILAYADENSRSHAMAHTCIQQGLSVDQSKALLDAAPVPAKIESAPASIPGLAMTNGHDLGADAGEMTAEQDDRAAAQAAVLSFYGRKA